MCAAQVKFNENHTINIISAYLPKGPNELNTEWLHTLQDKEKWLIAGDFNAHSPFWDKDCASVTSNRFVENIVDSCLFMLNDGRITRIPDISTHTASAIDLTLVSPALAPECNWNTFNDTLGSDHLPIIITFNEMTESYESDVDKIPKYNYKLADWEKFKNSLYACHTESIDTDNIDQLYSYFTCAILKAADVAIPKFHPIQSNKHSGNIWWTPTCDAAVNNKKAMFETYLKDKSPENLIAKRKANHHSNMVIAQVKRQYWSSFCTNEISNYTDLQKVWKKFHEMKKGVNLPSCPIRLKNKEFPSNSEKAELFADMFSDSMRLEGLAPKKQTFRTEEERKDEYKDPVSDNSHFINAPITFDEVKDALISLPNKKSSVGLDIVSNDMLKHLPDNFVFLLHKLFQKCWVEGVMPEHWKQSVIVPILKHGKTPVDKHSYRPVALTSHTCKLLERIILRRLVHYCEVNKIIPINQAGFRKGRSAMDNLVKLTTNIKQQFARRKNVVATFFDIKKPMTKSGMPSFFINLNRLVYRVIYIILLNAF